MQKTIEPGRGTSYFDQDTEKQVRCGRFLGHLAGSFFAFYFVVLKNFKIYFFNWYFVM